MSIREHPTSAATEPRRRRWAFLARPGWIAVILAAVAFAGACFFLLAPWQFNRHAERSAQNAAVDTAITAPTVPVTDLLSTAAQPPSDVAWRVVNATGRFDPNRQVQVRLRQDSNGQPVSEVIVPFRLDTGQTLLVDRGYVSFADVRSGAPIAAVPPGAVTITGRVQDEQVDPSNRPPLVVGDHVEAYAINVDAVGGGEAGEVFLQGYIQLTADSPGVLTPIELPQTDAGPFLSYALQWEVFGVVALIGLCVFIYREAVAPRPPDDHGDGTGADVGDGHGRAADDAPAARPAAPLAGPAGLAGPAQAGPAASDRRRRRARDGFDRSQLYDD